MMKRIKKQKAKLKNAGVNIFLLFVCCANLNTISAQTVSATLDRDKILLGEQVTLELRISNITNGGAFVAAWPQPADTTGKTEIIKTTPIDTINISGNLTYAQKFTLTSFDSGRWQLGPFNFIVQDKFTGKQTQFATQPVYLSVLPVDVSTLQDYHPLKEIIDVPTSFNWKPVWISAIVLAIVVLLLRFILKRKKQPVLQKTILKGSPLTRALEKLAALQQAQLISTATIKNFHSETDDIIRLYFEEILHIDAMQLTERELFSRLSVHIKDEKLQRKFQQFFQLNAAVKFAKYLPQADDSKNMMSELIINLHQVDDYINEMRIHADRMVSKY